MACVIRRPVSDCMDFQQGDFSQTVAGNFEHLPDNAQIEVGGNSWSDAEQRCPSRWPDSKCLSTGGRARAVGDDFSH